MSRFNILEKETLEKLFNRGGYVLDFSDRTFSDFFEDYDINIYDEKYRFNGTSKMKHLRAFWETESDKLVGEILEGLLVYALFKKQISPENESYIDLARKIIARLQGKNVLQKKDSIQEEEFLLQEFPEINWIKLNIDAPLQEVIQQRIKEIQITLKENAPLSAIFLCGSILEALLLNVACNNAQKFKNSDIAPKSKEIHEWTLNQLINTAYEVKLIRFDVTQYSHSIRKFRNYIHPQLQVSAEFKPTKRTAEISWKVVQAVIEDLSEHKGV